MSNNPASKVIILKNDMQKYIVNVFMQIPWEYGFSGIVGKKYIAIKDYLKIYNLKKRDFLPIFVRMGEIWAGAGE